MRVRPILLNFVCFLILAAPPALAQQGMIIGTAVDETKAALPGVAITATDQDTGRVMSAVTDDRGEYRIVNVLPGKYTIQAELAGFTTISLKDIEILVGQNARIPLSLKLATVNETLTVLAESPLVDTASSQVSGNVDRRQMEELPLQGRNWMELSKMIKGITANDVGNTPGVSRDDDFQLNLDGQQITQKIAGSGFGQPKFSRESIAEFQIVTNMFDITQGRSAGIQVQADLALGNQQDVGQRSTATSATTSSTPRMPSPIACCRTRTSRWAAPSAARSARTARTTSCRTNTSANRPRSSRHRRLCPARASRFPIRTASRASSRASITNWRRTTASRCAVRDGTGKIPSCLPPAATRRMPRSRPRTRPTSAGSGRKY